MDFATGIAAIKSTLALKNAGTTVWGPIARFFTPNRLKIEIDAALKSDPEVIQPPPQLDRERLTEDAVKQLLSLAVTGNVLDLGEHLRQEQIVHLPPYPSERPQNWEAVWYRVAQTVQRGVLDAVIADEQLHRQFMVLSQQQGSPELVAQVAALSDSIKGLEKQVAETLEQSGGIQEQQPFYIDSVATARVENRLLDQVDQLEDKLRQELDEKVERLWGEIVEQIDQRNFRAAIEKGKYLKNQIEADKHTLSGIVLGRTYLLLAQVALIESHDQNDVSEDYQSARQFFNKAKNAFGTDVDAENQRRLANFQAKQLGLAGGYEEAIATLGDATDPQSVSTRLLIYIDGGDEEKAVQSIRGMQLHAKWCEYAAFATQRTGDDDDADRVLKWTIDRGYRELEERCRLAIAKAILLQVEGDCGTNALTPLSISDNGKSQVTRARNILSPIAAKCLSVSRIENGVEADAVGFTYECCRLLGDQTRSRLHVKLLHDFQPTHFGYAKAMIRGDVEFDAEFTARLRIDYPLHFMAHDFALTLELQTVSNLSEFIVQVERLGKLATTDERKEKVARTIFQIATTLKTDQIANIRDVAVRLVGESHFTVKSIDAYRWMRERDWEKFRKAVEEIECEGYLKDQFRAQLLTIDGRHGQAAEILLRSAKRICDQGMLREAAMLAMHAKPHRLDIAVEALESAVRIDERNPETNELLADVYMQLHAYLSAANCFKRLRVQNDDWRYALNHAICYVLENQPNEALLIFDELCQRSDVPLKAHLARSTLLVDIGDPKAAWASLEAISEQFWETPEFLLAFTHVAYAAGDDKAANTSFQQLLKLHKAGLVSETLLKSGSADDLIQLSEEAQEHRNFLLDQSLAGKLPWLFCERLLGNTAYWGWRFRTQPKKWFYDDARGRASNSTYATNGYAVVHDQEKRPQVLRLHSPPSGKPIVADFSAIMTLHRLGILEAALSYFGHVKIPPSYSVKIGREIGELQPIQLSAKKNLQVIKSLVDNRLIQVVENAGDTHVVDEYCKETNSNNVRIADLLNAMHNAGKLSENQLREAKLVAHKPALLGSDEKLAARTSIVVKGQTIRTIAGLGLLHSLCETFEIGILDEDIVAANRELRMFDEMEETKQWNIELWNQLGNNSRVYRDTIVIPPLDMTNSDAEDDETTDPVDQTIPAIDASLLAQQERLPLLADDRVCHSMIYKVNHDSSSSAFSSDLLIDGMVNDGKLDVNTAAQAYLKLIQWRYRFLIIPPVILRTIAMDFAPIDLRIVAQYLHDCMRDLGLFGGPESAEPPLPIAFRFFQDWLQVIALFIANVWLDSEINEDRAGDLTDWAMRELVPPPPLAMGNRVDLLADFTPTTILVHAMMRLTQTRDEELANRALRRIAHGLGLNDQEFLRIATDIIDRND